MIPQILQTAVLLLENLALISRESRFYTGKSKKEATSISIPRLTGPLPAPALMGRVFSFCQENPGKRRHRTSTSAPNAQCSHNRHTPRAHFHFRRGTCAGRERPAPGSDQSISPNKAVPPGAEWGNSRLPPSERSGRNRAALRSCYGGIRLRQPTHARAFHPRWPGADWPLDRALRGLEPDNALGELLIDDC